MQLKFLKLIKFCYLPKNPPIIWNNIKTNASVIDIVLSRTFRIDTPGLKWPPDIFPKSIRPIKRPIGTSHVYGDA